MPMAESFNKRELQKKREQKKQEKQKRKEERKASGRDSFDDMIAYVDENGVITNTPPDPTNKLEVGIESIAISTPKKEDVEDPVLEGRVDYFNPDKGFGFIKQTDNMNKYFFHISSAPALIAEGNMVTFELERGPKGMNAVRIAVKK
ncbi:cold-shock protein [Parabacteroides bouchesdurhonensis]|uniref:cold-shock protein n=1 Tax=Parabacteroides bouchesdurhonensis TaxID=1936995 RepID=UPI00164DD838|nr:cold shock domain-containing protein [Parabacteroides bouchesdurhonensis]